MFICELLFITQVEFNRRVYVWEDDLWAVKGRYQSAVEDDDTVVWDTQDGKLVLRVAMVRYFHYMMGFNLTHVTRTMMMTFPLVLLLFLFHRDLPFCRQLQQ
jgi:hypothetical protein